MMEEENLLLLMQHHGVKPTPNRLLIARELSRASGPLTIGELECRLETIDKSNVFRCLQTFRDAHLVHVLEDAGDGMRFELCHSHHPDEDDDVHVHFLCRGCHRTFCLPSVPIPSVEVPAGYAPETVNYFVKGLCPACCDKYPR